MPRRPGLLPGLRPAPRRRRRARGDERAIALAVRDGDAAAVKAALLAGGYLPAQRADAVDAELALALMRMAIKWYAVPGERRFSPDGRRDRDRDRERQHPDSEERAAIKAQVNQFTLPPSRS